MEPTLENVRKAYGQYVKQALKYGYKPNTEGRARWGYRNPFIGYHQMFWPSKMPTEFQDDRGLYELIAFFRIQDADIKRLEDFMDSAGYTDAQKRVVYKYILDGVEYVIAQGFSPKGIDHYSRLELSGVLPRAPVAVGQADPLRRPRPAGKTSFGPVRPTPGGTRRRKSTGVSGRRKKTQKARSRRWRNTGSRTPQR
jgi:hypothetical protein